MRGWRAWAAVVAVGLMVGGVTAQSPIQVDSLQTIQVSSDSLKTAGLIEFPCVINGHRRLVCELDTGATVGIYMSQAQAKYFGVPMVASWGGEMTVTGWAPLHTGKAELEVGNDHAVVQVFTNPGYQGVPLIGLEALRALGIEDVLIDLQGPSLIMVDKAPQGK